MERLTTEIKKKFIELDNQLSPENISCDGELSRTEVNRRYSQLMRKWRALERLIGRKVEPDSDETFSWMKEIYKW